MKTILEILKNYKFVKLEFYMTIITRMILAIILLYLPFLTKKIYEVIESKGTLEELYYSIWILAIFSFIAVAVTLFSNLYQAKLWLNLYAKKNIYYRKIILDKNNKDIINIGTGKLLTRLESGVHSEVHIFTKILKIFTDVVFRGTLIVVIVSLYMIEFLWGMFFSIIILSIVISFLRKYIDKYSKIEQKNWEEDGRNKVKVIMEQLTISLYGKKEYELNKNKIYLDEASKYGIKVDVINESFYKLIEIVVRSLEILILFIVGGIILTTGKYQLSHLIMFTWYIMSLWDPLNEAITNLNEINKVWEKYKKLQDFINLPNTIKPGKNKYVYKSGEIEFSNVDFSYDTGKQIFKKLDLKFLPGKRNALIGHSGGGKSTITKIILRLFDYQNGKVLIDGQDLKKLNIDTFYKHIGYLPQEPAIFDGTIRENLEYAFSNNTMKYDDSIIWEALEKSKIDDMVKGLKNGLETEVGEKGIKLSGGEKQRLAIARIFLKNPEIIILDEPTSALDSINEAKITKTLNELMKGKTSIIIAHRLQTVMSADNIIIIEDGKIENIGKHKDLLKKSNVYKTLVDLQNGKIVE